MRVRWTPPSFTPYGYRIQAEGDLGSPQSVVVTGGNTNMRDLTVQNGVTYTVSIQTLSSTQLPSVVVEVPYQDRTSQLLAIQLVCSTLIPVTGQEQLCRGIRVNSTLTGS